jgi:hypothetical protein
VLLAQAREIVSRYFAPGSTDFANISAVVSSSATAAIDRALAPPASSAAVEAATTAPLTPALFLEVERQAR